MGKGVVLDCEEGRRRGCASYCCRLIVRLQPGEKAPGGMHHPDKHCVDKDPESGLCVHFDVESAMCQVWQDRPQVCRSFDCNTDPLMPIILRDGFRGLRHLLTAPEVPRRKDDAVPYVEE